MKNKKTKMLFSAVLAILMVLSLVPMFAFADDAKELEVITVEGVKPQATSAYARPDGKVSKTFDLKSADEKMFKVIETKFEAIAPDGTKDFVPTFWGNENYLVSFKVKVSERYAIPDDLADIGLDIKYTNAENVSLRKDNFFAPNRFLMKSGTYTIEYIADPDAPETSEADLEVRYAFTVEAQPLPKIVFKTGLPKADDYYLEPDGKNPLYEISFIGETGFMMEKQGWLHMESLSNIHFVNKFEAGEKYVMAAGLTFSPRYGMYEMPKDLADVKFKIDFANAKDVELKPEDYRAGDKFKFEVGTYTFRLAKTKTDEQPMYEFIYVIEIPKAEKPTDKPVIPDTEPETKAPQTTAPETTKKEESKVPNTGAASSIAVGLFLASAVSAGAAYASKKKKR